MKFMIFLLLMFSLRTCYKVEPRKKSKFLTKEELVKPSHVSDHATLVNMGFVDKPVYAWIEYIGDLHEEGQIYNHIGGFKCTFDSGNIDTSYYEMKDRSDFNIDTGNYKIQLYPGNATMNLVKTGEEKLIYIVLEIEDDDLEWRRVCVVALNSRNEVVSNDVTLIKFEKLETKDVRVKFKDYKGFRDFIFESSGDFSNDSKVSYLDRSTGTIYLLGKDDKLVIKDKSKIDLL